MDLYNSLLREPCPPALGCLACHSLAGPDGISRWIHPIHVYRVWDFILSNREVLHHQTPWRIVEPFLMSRGYFLDQLALSEAQGATATPKNPLTRPATTKSGFEVVIKSLAVEILKRPELKVWRRLTSRNALKDPRNHTAPVVEFIVFKPEFPGYPPLHTDDREFLVIPKLFPLQNDNNSQEEFLPPDVQSSLDYFFQILEGIEYMHLCGIAHGNLGSHSLVLSRTSSGQPRYHFADFELSSIHTPGQPPSHLAQRELSNAAPQHSTTHPFNPFPNDIYVAGQWLWRCLTTNELIVGVHPNWNRVPRIEGLVSIMQSSDPRDRPTASEARQIVESIISSLPEQTLRLPIARRYTCTQGNPRPPTLDEALASVPVQSPTVQSPISSQ